MSWCSDAPEDEAISLFAGLLANPDVRLSRGQKQSTPHTERNFRKMRRRRTGKRTFYYISVT
jgi:hypothetical protein